VRKKRVRHVNRMTVLTRLAVADKFQRELVYWDENVLEGMFDPKRMYKAIVTLNVFDERRIQDTWFNFLCNKIISIATGNKARFFSKPLYLKVYKKIYSAILLFSFFRLPL